MLISDIPLPQTQRLIISGRLSDRKRGVRLGGLDAISDIPIDVSIAPDDGWINLKDVVGLDLHLFAGSAPSHQRSRWHRSKLIFRTP